MKSRKNLIIIALVVLISVVGITYAFFNYYKLSERNLQLITGEIYLRLNEGTEQIMLTNAFPETAEEARSRDDNFVTFSIVGKNTTTNRDIWYEIMLNDGDSVDGRTRLDPEHVRYDLIEIVDGVETYVVDDRSFDTLNATRVWVNTVNRNTTEEVEITYKLRMWIGEDVLISDTDTNASYTTGEYKNSYASVKVSVYGDFEEKTMGTVVETVKSRLGSDGLVAINTNGELYTEGDTIREYRYSGNGNYCTYTSGDATYTLNVEGDTCPNACVSTDYVIGMDNDFFPIYNAAVLREVDCDFMGGVEVNANETTPLTGEVNNYISFNNELWRIIGIFNEEDSQGVVRERIKIVKDAALSQEQYPNTTYTYNTITYTLKPTVSLVNGAYYYWNSEKAFGQTNGNDWTNAGLQYYLNDTENAESYYNSIDEKYQKMIETMRYSLGNVAYDDLAIAQNVYVQERGSGTVCSTSAGDYYTSTCDLYEGNQASWSGKVGLMYPSDYIYAASSANWNTGGTKENWLNDNTSLYEWTISPSASNSDLAIYTSDLGFEEVNLLDSSAVVYPVVYLKSTILISEGDGTQNNPYLLK